MLYHGNDSPTERHNIESAQLVPFSELFHRTSYLIILFLNDPGNQIS